MKASKLITLIQQGIDQCGDKDIVLLEQTGPDSWVFANPVAVGPCNDGTGVKLLISTVQP